jgi:hypothetical protein
MTKEAAHDPAGHNRVDGDSRGGSPFFRGYSLKKEKKLRNRLGIGLIALIFLLAMPVFAQNNAGIISGRVMDSTGAMVPNAQITITQTDTNVDTASGTNADGLFRSPGLRDGPYKVTVSAPGFKKAVREGFNLRIGEILNVEIKLEVGSVSESIDVVNSIPLLDTQTSAAGQVMEGEYFYELPNDQHWEKGVLYYTPQVETSNGVWPGALGNFNFNGGQTWQTGQYEDGIIATTMDGGTTLNSVSVGIEEVKVISGAMPAEYGHATSGALIVVKKAGTNQLHGEGGYLFKNQSMMHRRFFQKTTIQQDNPNNRTLFQMPDFTVSGPVYIPHIYHGKNKTFFEIGASWHVDTSSNSGSYTVPTDAMMAGDFSAYSNTLWDPASTSGTFAAGNIARTAFPGNVIPQSRFSTLWKNIAATNPFSLVKPQPGIGSNSPTGPNGNVVTSGTGNYFNKTEQARLDHSFTDKFKVSLSYHLGRQHQPQNNVTIGYAPLDQYQSLNYTIQTQGTVNFTYTVTPTLISETRIGEYRRNSPGGTKAGNDYTFALAKMVPNLPSNVYLNGIGYGLSEGTNGGGTFGVGTQGVNVQNMRQVSEDLTKVWRTHAFKFGYEWLWENSDSHNIGNPRLSLTFADTNNLTGVGQGVPNTGGITIANLMLGYINGYNYSQQGTPSLPVDSIHSLYIQDDWRLTPKLTLNLGLRYSNETPAHSKFPGGFSIGSLTAPDNFYTASVPGVINCPVGGCLGAFVQPKGFLWNRDNNNFRPRVGLAWNLEKNTVVRAGFGMITLDWNTGYTTQNEIGGGSFFNQTVTQPTNTFAPLFNINQGVPAFVSVPQNAAGQIPTSRSNPAGGPSITVYPSNYHNPYVLNWNVGIQHSLWKNYVVELDYVGMHNVGFGGGYNWQSRPFGTGVDANGNPIDLSLPANAAYRNSWIGNSSAINGTQAWKPYPNLNGVTYECNCSRYIYHSGTVKLEKRYSNGLSLLTFLTYQKGISNSPGNLYMSDQEQRAVSGTTNKYRYVSSMIYELPFGKGKHFLNHSRLGDRIMGGWSFSWNYNVWAPTPQGLGYSSQSVINPATGALGGRQSYPSYEAEPGSGLYRIGTPVLRSDWQDIGTNRWTQATQNPMVTNCGVTPILMSNGATWGNNCEVVAPSFTRGNMGSNFWYGQRIISANSSMYKDFTIKERYKAQIRLDYYNPFKWFNWSQPNATMNQTQASTFMTPGPNDLGDSQEGGPPQMHISFRVHF